MNGSLWFQSVGPMTQGGGTTCKDDELKVEDLKVVRDSWNAPPIEFEVVFEGVDQHLRFRPNAGGDWVYLISYDNQLRLATKEEILKTKTEDDFNRYASFIVHPRSMVGMNSWCD